MSRRMCYAWTWWLDTKGCDTTLYNTEWHDSRAVMPQDVIQQFVCISRSWVIIIAIRHTASLWSLGHLLVTSESTIKERLASTPHPSHRPLPPVPTRCWLLHGYSRSGSRCSTAGHNLAVYRRSSPRGATTAGNTTVLNVFICRDHKSSRGIYYIYLYTYRYLDNTNTQ